MKTVQLGETTINWPEGWHELDFKSKMQLSKLSTGLLAITGLEAVMVWREIMRQLTVNSEQLTISGGAWNSWFVSDEKRFKKWWAELEISFEQFEELKTLTSWVQEKPTELPFESFTHKGVSYIVVKERFSNVSAGEWVEGLMDFLALTSATLSDRENDSKDIDILIANFCRPERADLDAFKKSENWNGDTREPYNRQKALERAKVLKDLDAGVKVQLLWWIESLITAFFEEFNDLFRSPKNSGDGDNAPRYPDGRGYLMLLKNVAKAGYLGDFERVTNTDVTTVFALLLDEVYDNEEVNSK